MVSYLSIFTVKAGGMRVASKQKVSEKQDPDAYDKKYVDQLPEKS